MKAKYIVAIAVLFAGWQAANASTYGHSVGMRLGNHFAADYKFYFAKHSACDFTFGIVNPFVPQYQFILFSGAYGYHIGTGVPGLTPYVGGGLSAGTRFGDIDHSMRDKVDFFLSVDVPVGLEYIMRKKPIVFFFEWSPKLQVVRDVRFVPVSVAAGVRFVLPHK